MERWFAAAGPPPRLDLARSGAPPRSTADLLALAPPVTTEAYLSLALDYGPAEGSEQLREAIVSTGAAGRADQVVVTNGAIEALFLACAANLDHRDQVAVATPAYEGMLLAPAAAGARVVPVPVWSPGAQSLDLSGLDDDVLRECRAVLLNVPHNPTGLVAEPSQLAGLAERCRTWDTLLVVDEVARGAMDPESASLGRSAAFEAGAVAVVGDVSKTFGLGGLRIGWLSCACPRLLARASRLRDVTSLGTAAPSQFLAAIALERSAALGTVSLAVANRAALGAWVSALPGADWSWPIDGLVAFPRIPLAAASSMAVAARLRASAGVAVVPGALFGVEGHLRISLGQHPGAMDEALALLRATLVAMAEARGPVPLQA